MNLKYYFERLYKKEITPGMRPINHADGNVHRWKRDLAGVQKD
jgi:hypothetical protein